MEDGKEDSTIDFPSLCFLSARVIYYINVNCMYNLQKAVIDPFLCSCDKYSGCRKPNDVRDYCDICSLNIKHDPYENKKKYKIKHLIEKHIEMVNDFNKYNINIKMMIIALKLSIRCQNFLSMKVFLMGCSLKKTHFIN